MARHDPPRPEGIADAGPPYRPATAILDPAAAPAAAPAALYRERREIEGAPAAPGTPPRGARMVPRGGTPEPVRREFRGLHAVRAVRRKPPLFAALPPSAQASPA